jgi:hypothetical protein
VEPTEEFLESRIRQDFFNGVEVVAQFIVRPGLVDEILAAVACGRNLASALATRHDVMSACGNVPFAKDASFVHGHFRFFKKVFDANRNW